MQESGTTAPASAGFFMACVQTPAGIAQGPLVWTDGERGAVRVGEEVIEGKLIQTRRHGDE